MNVEGFLGSEEERAARRLLEQANDALKGRGGRRAGIYRAAVRACRTRGSRRLPAGRDRRARRAGLAIPAIAQTRRSENPVRGPANAAGRDTIEGCLRHRDRQRRHAVPGRFGHDGALGTRSSIRLVVHPILTTTRDSVGSAHGASQRAQKRRLRAARKFHPHSCRTRR